MNNFAASNAPVMLGVLAAIAIFLLILISASVRMVREYQRAVVFRLGRCVGSKGPGLFLIIPFVDKTVITNLQIVAVPVTPQAVITKDNVTVTVDAVAFFQIVDPARSVVQIHDWYGSSQLVAQTTLRSVVGRHELDQLLAERDRLDAEIQVTLDEQTEPWGIKVHRVEIRDVGLPEQMQRAMAKQAEAERERRAKVIAADGEFQASKRLADAARVIATSPGALHLRQLQTLAEISVTNSSTIVFPIPVELFDAAKSIVSSAQAADAAMPAILTSDPDVGLDDVQIPEIPDVPTADLPAPPDDGNAAE